MKKATLENIKNVLETRIPVRDEVVDELIADIDAELNRGAEQKAKNAQVYDSFHDIVMDTLSDTPVTIAELWDAIAEDVPDGVTKGKLQYAVTRLWKDEIVKVDGNPNSYRKA